LKADSKVRRINNSKKKKREGNEIWGEEGGPGEYRWGILGAKKPGKQQG